MATYGYEVVDRTGKEIKGSMEADSPDKVKRDLKNQGYTIISVTEQNFLNRDLNIDISGGPTARDLSVFCRQFVSMTRAGVSILEAMRMLCEQTENKKLKRALDEVRASVQKGESLAESLAKHPKVFPGIMINMVAAGEASGSLETSMDRVATQLEKNSKTHALIKKAMIYPIVVAVVAVAVVIVMLVFVIPTYAEMFEDLDTELPWITVAVMTASRFVQHRWFILFPAIFAAIAGLRAWGKKESGRKVFGKIALAIPAIKNLTVKSASSQMARTLSTLLGAGVPMIEAIDIVSHVMNNYWFEKAMQEAKDQVAIGVQLSRPLENSKLFPPMVYHMIRIGEESGNTEEMLDKLADYYEEEVEMAVQSLMAALEPVIIIVLAGIVGILVGAVIAPMVTMYGALDSL